MECDKFEECGRPAEFGRLCLVHEKRRRSAAQTGATRAAESPAEDKPTRRPRKTAQARSGAKTTAARTRKSVPAMQTTETKARG